MVWCQRIATMAPCKTSVFLNQLVEFLVNENLGGRGKVTKVSNLDVLHGSRVPKGCYGVEVIQVYKDKDADLPHLLPMDEDIKTLRMAINTTIAWPRVDLNIVQGGSKEDLSSQVQSKSNKLDEIVDKLKKNIPTKSMVYTSHKGKEKNIGSLNVIGSEDKLVEEELQAYFDGANAGGEFPINNNVILRQDMLSKHLNQLLDTRGQLLPWIPLCCLTKLEKARQVSWDRNRLGLLSDSFSLEGYFEPKGSFICSTEEPGFPCLEVTSEIMDSWDDSWKQLNKDFEEEIAPTCWKDLSGKMFYTWDGNHRLATWMGVLQRCKQDI